MELSYEEKLQLDNSKEHLKTVQVNIRMANEELKQVLNKVDEANATLVETQNLNVQIKEDNLSEHKKSLEIEKTSKEFTKKVNSLSLESKALADKIRKQEARLEALAVKIIESASKYDKIIKEKNEEIEFLRERIMFIDRKKIDSEKEYDAAQETLRTLQVEITTLQSEIDEEHKNLERMKLQYQIELSIATGLVEAEKEKIQNPLKLIRIESAKNARISRSLGIHANRLRKQFLQQNPDTMLPVELQETK